MRYLNTALNIGHRTLIPIENLLIHHYSKEEIRYPPVFLIGAPRTGSSILYEYITNDLEVNYINNLMCKFYITLYIASIVSKIIFRNKQHNCFDSHQGMTKGLNSPSECGRFWYRWFPRDRHFVDFNELDIIQIKQIQEIVTALVNKHNKPLVIKNMNCGQRLRVIRDVFPIALFIYCKRDPLFTAQSIIETRERVFNNRLKWWSIMPKEYNDLVILDYPEQVVKQIYCIQKQIEEDLCLFGEKQWIEIWYEDFCRSPRLIMDKVKNFFNQNGTDVKYKAEVIEEKVHFSQQRRIDSNTYNKLIEIINSLDW